MNVRLRTNCAWFLGGLALSGIAALLLAPQAGYKTRKLIRRKAEDTADFLRRDMRRQAAQKYHEFRRDAAKLLHGAENRLAA